MKVMVKVMVGEQAAGREMEVEEMEEGAMEGAAVMAEEVVEAAGIRNLMRSRYSRSVQWPQSIDLQRINSRKRCRIDDFQNAYEFDLNCCARLLNSQ